MVTRHNKDGSLATCVQLSHNVWDPQAKREGLLAKLRKGLGGLKGPGHSRACCALLSHPTYGPYLKQDRQGRPHIDREKMALAYKQLAGVESALRCLKQGLELWPMYHRLEDSIRSLCPCAG